MTDGSPALSIIVLAWDQLHHTTACVDSLRRHTDVDHELIIVDNGSAPPARAYAESAADVPVLNDDNLGFAGGMNAGLGRASAPVVVFANNDTRFPPGWASPLLATLAAHPAAAIVTPGVTAASSDRTVLEAPDDVVEVLAPFGPVPAAVVWLMPTATARQLGGFDERYHPASGEDLDLAFKVWVNDLDIVFDHRVLVDHVGKGTAAAKLPNWRATWRENGDRMLTRWEGPATDVPRMPSVDVTRFTRNLLTAAAVSGWMRRYYTLRQRRVVGRTVIERGLGWSGMARARFRDRPTTHAPSDQDERRSIR